MPKESSAKPLKKELSKHQKLKRDLMDDLFNDYYRERWRIYKINFVRGIFFGLGTFIGGTVIIALVILLLGWLANTFPEFSTFFQWLIQTLSKHN